MNNTQKEEALKSLNELILSIQESIDVKKSERLYTPNYVKQEWKAKLMEIKKLIEEL